MSKADRENCELRAENAAAMRVVDRAYEAGKLGTRAQIQKELPGDRIFTADGRMLRYDELAGDSRVHFEEWMNTNDRVYEATGDAQFEARKAVRANPPKACR